MEQLIHRRTLHRKSARGKERENSGDSNQNDLQNITPSTVRLKPDTTYKKNRRPGVQEIKILLIS